MCSSECLSLRIDFGIEHGSGVNLLGRLQLFVGFVKHSRKALWVYTSTDQSYERNINIDPNHAWTLLKLWNNQQ